MSERSKLTFLIPLPKTQHFFGLSKMTDLEAPASSSSKRVRDDDGDSVLEMPPADIDDSSDEEIGPMPVPGADGTEVKVTNGRRKKRAGKC
jgi:hypothetical protein